MKKFMKKCLGVAAALLVANFAVGEVKAGLFNQCSPCEAVACNPCDAACDVGCGKKSLFEFGGWLESGLYVNQYGQRNSYFNGAEHNLRDWSGNTRLLNNVHQSDFQLNQIWLYAGKKLDTRRGFDYGGRVDFVYGTDAKYTQSQGLEYGANPDKAWGEGDYYTSFAQVYGEVGYKSVSVKVGKFLTPMEHEGIMATERFFYSLSYQFANLPVTHTGALATWAPNKKVSVFGGWVCGQNAAQEDLTFYNEDNNAALFGAKYNWNNKVTLAYSAMIGREDDYSLKRWGVAGDRDYFVHSLIVNITPNKRWDYTFQWTLRNEDDGYSQPPVNPAVWNWGAYGINQELIYRINTKWAVGARFEWMHTYSDGGMGTGYNGNAYEFTLGANWTPTKWLLIRPEMRYDKVFGGGEPFNTIKGFGADSRDEQFSGGVSTIVKY